MCNSFWLHSLGNALGIFAYLGSFILTLVDCKLHNETASKLFISVPSPGSSQQKHVEQRKMNLVVLSIHPSIPQSVCWHKVSIFVFFALESDHLSSPPLSNYQIHMVKRNCLCWVAQLFGALSHMPKFCVFKSQSNCVPRLQVQSPVGVCTGGTQLMFFSHINVSLSLSLKSINISSGED